MGAVAVFLGSLAVTIPLGVPIAFVLALCALALMTFLGMTDMSIITQNMIMGTNKSALMAIPFFMLSGEIMSRGGLSQRIVDFSNIAVGRFRGGLGYAAILASMIFAGLSGSPVADAAALGGMMIPLMVKNGYSKERSTGLLCSGAVIAPIIPPSVPMIVLGTSVGLSITKMFMAGLVPGIILGLCLMVCWKILVSRSKVDDRVHFTKEQRNHILKDSLPALFMPILIIGGIRFGIFTPTEAGSFAVVYALIISLFVYREIEIKDLPDIFLAGLKSTGLVMIIVATASAVGWLITVAQIPAKVITLLHPLIAHPTLLVLVINLFLFIMGMIMDLTPNILIFGPILVPLVEAAGVDPIVFAVIMVLNLTIGLITPPVGTILYIGCSIADLSFGRVVKGVLPFLFCEVLVLLLFSIFPQLISVPMSIVT